MLCHRRTYEPAASVVPRSTTVDALVEAPSLKVVAVASVT